VDIDEENNEAVVEVSEDQQSLAIGKGGQNVRLAAKLTGWKIDIRSVKGENLAEGQPDEIGVSDTETEKAEKSQDSQSDELAPSEEKPEENTTPAENGNIEKTDKELKELNGEKVNSADNEESK